MSAKIFSGKLVAEEILEDVAARIKRLGKAPKLLSFYNPKDPASALYTRIKKQKAENVGIEFEDREIEWIEDTVGEIREMGGMDTRTRYDNGQGEITGILVQHPTGEEAFSEEDWKRLVEAIPKEKDVDGLRDDSPFVPATVRAILVALDEALRLPSVADTRIPSDSGQQGKLELSGCKIAVVGATGMVGKPLVKVLEGKRSKVKRIDETTGDIWYQTKSADVVISAVGKHNLIHGNQIKEGAIVIDVGSPGGDVHFESALAVASFITPVPGGIGPLTVACLLENTVIAAEQAELSHQDTL